MPQLLNTPALVNLPINLRSDEICENTCVLHMAGYRPNFNV